jgi:hydroxymethylglutaryl-CoA reductase
MKTINVLEHFLFNESTDILNKLTIHHQPVWGLMNAQQMVEHLSLAVEVGNGKRKLLVENNAVSAEKLKRIVLLTDRPLPKGFQNPVLPTTPIPLMYADINEAIHKLYENLLDLKQYFTENPTEVTTHNIFGHLNYHEWLWFHYKHFMHHFAQFKLVSEVTKFAD